jgi:phosphoribosylformylglycinamidine (FGAM) synthase-like enzyme
VLRIKEQPGGIACSTDGPGHLCALDPHIGGMHAVKEAYLNLVAVGAEPLAYTNCLNFASPENPVVMAGFCAIVEGMAEASRALETPVVSGNVSFYNQTVGGRVMPTPVIGMVGYIPDVSRTLRHKFAVPGLELYCIAFGEWKLDGSCLAWDILHERDGSLAAINLVKLAALKDLVLKANAEDLLACAHDIDSGGMALALAECCHGGHGADIVLPDELLSETGGLDKALFGFPPVGIILGAHPDSGEALKALAAEHDLSAHFIGNSVGEKLLINAENEPKHCVSIPAQVLADIHAEALPYWLGT